MPAFTDPPAVPPELPSGCVMTSVVVPAARHLNAAGLTAAVEKAYDELRRRALVSGGLHFVRIWNYVPALLAPAEGGNRYMAFNAGRYAAMRNWYGDALAALAPAATGVGAPGDNLIIHGLSAAEPGTALQNPRQTPAVDYSARYGRRPPCFARATRVGRVRLVSGTAGITGEDTAAPDDLAAQLNLTLDHLAAVGGGLANYRSLRAYVPRADDAETVRQRLAAAVPHVGDVRPVVVDLCRPELRVEIEGVAVESEAR